MIRPEKHEVDICLLVARPGAHIGPNVACVLAAEVHALRADYADLEARALASLEQMTRDATTAITGAGIDAELAEAYAAQTIELARVKGERDNLAADRDNLAADNERLKTEMAKGSECWRGQLKDMPSYKCVCDACAAIARVEALLARLRAKKSTICEASDFERALRGTP